MIFEERAILQRSSHYKGGFLKLAGKVKSICEEKIVPIIENLGYEVVEVEYVKKSDGMNLTFYIDCDEGVKIDDCEKVSKEIDPILEQLNPTDDTPYILSVSSPGIDRPLKTDRDYKRNIGSEVSVSLFAKQNGKKKYDGILNSFDKDHITIIVDNEKIEIEKSKIAHIVPIIKF